LLAIGLWIAAGAYVWQGRSLLDPELARVDWYGAAAALV
jgi:hypothetical protein